VAVYGITRHQDARGRLTSMVPCDNCSLARCTYRRRPYRHATPDASSSPEELPQIDSSSANTPARNETADQAPDRPSAVAGAPAVSPHQQQRRSALHDSKSCSAEVAPHPAPPLTHGAQYRTPRKALQRWARERLTLSPRDDGGMDARFRYDGTTCTNMGRELAFLYDVRLGPQREGYRILEQRCTPAPGDVGHTAMCGYLRRPAELMAAIEAERPLSGRTLDDVLSWARPISSAGCYCDEASRENKWGLVLETIHFALTEREHERRT
jgi:hypothetical protein